MGTQTAPIDLTLSYFERSNSMPFRFVRLISRIGADLGPMLLLNNRKSYVGVQWQHQM